MTEATVPQADEIWTAEKEASYQAHFTKKLSEPQGGGIGFLGAHRTGKTTLCKYMAETNPSIPFIQTSTSQIAADMGFDVNAPKSFEERLVFQEYVLLYHQQIYEAQNTLFWTDRTPLDFAAYLLADVPTGSVDPFTDLRVTNYLKRAVEITNAHFMTIVGVQPGIPYVVEEGKPALNVGYQEKCNALMMGLGRCYFKRSFYILDRSLTDPGDRASTVGKMVSQDLANYYAMLGWLSKQ